jgi:hypothetical protein
MGILSLPAGRLAGRELLGTEKGGRCVVRAAVWAPSVHNTRPWWFTADGPEISLHADAGRQLMVADPGGREMMISYGAALFIQTAGSVRRPPAGVLFPSGGAHLGSSHG